MIRLLGALKKNSLALVYTAALCIEVPLEKVVNVWKSVFLFVQMRRLLQQLQQKWLLRSPAQELRTVPTSFDAKPCFPREPLLPLPPPLPARARAQWRLDKSKCIFRAMCMSENLCVLKLEKW